MKRIRIVKGTGAGQNRAIVSRRFTRGHLELEVDPAWAIPPDETSQIETYDEPEDPKRR